MSLPTIEFVKANWAYIAAIAGGCGTFVVYITTLLWKTSANIATTAATLKSMEIDLATHDKDIREVRTTVGQHEVKLAIIEGHFTPPRQTT